MNKKLSNCLLAFVALVVFSAWGCEQAVPPSALEQQTDALAKQETAKSKIWPYIASQQKDVALAENLLTKNFVVILDGSGSMDNSGCSNGEKKLDVAKRAIIDWSTTVPAGANLGLVAFHNRWTTVELITKDQFSKGINEVFGGIAPDGNTPLATAVKLSYGMLTKQAQRQLGYGEYTIVVVTDGGDNDQQENLQNWVDRVLRNTPIRIYTIGFCIGNDHDLNQRGRTTYREANNPAELRKGLQEVLAEAEVFDVKGFSQ